MFGLPYDGSLLDAEPTFWNLTVVPMFFFWFSLVASNITRKSIEVRRALIRYDAQPAQQPATAMATEAKAARPDRLSLKDVRNCAKSFVFIMLMLSTKEGAEPISTNLFRACIGVGLSQVRPFSSMLRFEYVSAVSRASPKAHRDGTVNPRFKLWPVVVQHPIARTDLPEWARLLIANIRPAVIGFAAATTGLLFPIIVIASRFIRTAPTLPIGFSFGGLVLFMVAIGTAAAVLFYVVMAFLIGLLGGPGNEDHHDEDGSVPNQGVDPLQVLFLLADAFVLLLPHVALLAVARNFDLREWERQSVSDGVAGGDETDGLEAEIARLAKVARETNGGATASNEDPSLPLVHESVSPSPAGSDVQDLRLYDENGKRPEWLHGAKTSLDGIFMGRTIVQVLSSPCPLLRLHVLRSPLDLPLRIPGTRTRTASSPSSPSSSTDTRLALPTWSTAVSILQLVVLVLTGHALLKSCETPSGHPDDPAGSRRASSPISLGALLLDPRALTTRGEAVLPILLGKVACVAVLSWVGMALGCVGSVWVRRGWREGVVRFWREGDGVWSAPLERETGTQTAARPGHESDVAGAQEEGEAVKDGRLVVDV